jgi:hypothetical protein
MIRLKGWRSQHVEVELDEKDIVEAVIKMLRKKHKLENVDKLDEKGRMVEYVEYATSHSWISKEDRGKPTPAQKKALEFIEELQTLGRA